MKKVTLDTVLELIQKLSPKLKDPDNIYRVRWFIAYRVALELADCTTKQLANYLMDGFSGIDEEYINEWLAGFQEGCGTYEEAYTELNDMLIEFGYTEDFTDEN